MLVSGIPDWGGVPVRAAALGGGLSTHLHKGPRCVRLTPGQQATIVESPIAPRNIHPAYLLKRLPDRRDERGQWVADYGVYLRFKFLPQSKGDGLRPFVERVASCYAAANPFLRGPSGEFLSIHLAPADGEIDGLPPEITISLLDSVSLGWFWFGSFSAQEVSSPRGNSHQWVRSFGCAAILHETLHLLGLVDEYVDGVPDVGPRLLSDVYSGPTVGRQRLFEDAPPFGCRNVGPIDSIMSAHSVAYHLSLSPEATANLPSVAQSQLTHRSEVREFYSCSCDDADQAACIQGLRDLTPTSPSCPRYSRLKGPRFDRQTATDGTFVVPDQESALARVWRSRAIRAPGTSLLYPAHFRAITQPGCTDVNRVYYGCGRSAYDTPAQVDGGYTCPAIPDDIDCSPGPGWLN